MTADCGILQTIDELHARLDEQPDDWQTRLVLADALEEAGGEHAELAAGYRRLGELRIYPADMSRDPPPGFGKTGDDKAGWQWWNFLQKEEAVQAHRIWWDMRTSHWHPTRRLAEDAAARAYRPEFEESST
jgi:hypothetical protein